MRLLNRHILVTGGASGIGLAIARRFLAEGATVSILDRAALTAEAREALQNTQTQSQGQHPLSVHLADVRDAHQVQHAVADAIEAMQGLDGVVNAAGATMVRKFQDLELEQWQDTLAINLTGPFLVCKYALAALTQAGEKGTATIVNIASGAGLQPIPDRSAYCAAKGGLVMFSKALAIDLAPQNIRVNALCPGLIDTPMVEQSMSRAKDRDAEYQRAMSYRQIKRLGTADEMADATLFLTSDESSYMTGSALSVDGGRSFH